LWWAKAYTALLEPSSPGDEFEIKLGKKQIRLIFLLVCWSDDEE